MESKQGKKRPAAKDKESWKNKQGKKRVMPSSNIISLQSKRMFGAAGANSVIKIQKTAYPMPDCLITKLKVSNVATITTGAAGAFASIQFAPNSAYDPFAGAGTNQARFFDQLMAIYKSYTVYGVKMTLKVISRSTTNIGAVRVIAMPSVESTVPISDAYVDARELPYQMVWDIQGNSSAALVGNFTDKQEKSQYFDVAQFFGRDRQGLMDEANFSGTSATNPASLLYYYIAVQELAATNVQSVTVDVKITQYISFRQVASVASST